MNYDNNELLDGLPEVFKLIYKNIKILVFDLDPSYKHFVTLLEKEKENLKIGKD